MKNLPKKIKKSFKKLKKKSCGDSLLLFILGCLAISFILASKKLPGLVSNKPSPTPTPTLSLSQPTARPIPNGKRRFVINGGKRYAPQFKKGFIDPLTPKKGEKQTVGIEIENPVPVSSVILTMLTDHKKTDIPMKLTAGTEKKGTWQGSWQVDDNYLQNYQLKLIAEASNGKQETTITIR